MYICAPHSAVWPTSRAFTVAFWIWLMVTWYDKEKTFSFPFIPFRETFLMSLAKYWRSQLNFSFTIFWNSIKECLKKDGRRQVQDDTFLRTEFDSVNIILYFTFYNWELGLSLFSSFCIENKLWARRCAKCLSITHTQLLNLIITTCQGKQIQ